MLRNLIVVALSLFTLANLTSISRVGGYNFYLYDFYLLILNLAVFVWCLKKGILRINLNLILLVLFLVWSTVVTLSNVIFYDFNDQFLVLSYLFRFGNYSFFGFLIYSLLKSKILSTYDFQHILRVNFYLLVILNVLQYFIFRDISSLSIYGFDPHQTRLTGTFLDPNYMGIYLILYFIISENFLKSRFISYSSFLMLLLTESRSAFLTFLIAIVFLIFKSPKYFIYLALIISFSFGTSFVNRIELSKASNDSSNLRIESWKNAVQLYSFSPEFGVGFNNYRNMAKYFNLSTPEMYYANSSNSSDSSLLSILVMGGGLGLFLFVSYLFSFGYKVFENLIFLGVILFNSLFINSLFFPSVCVLVILILNFNLANKN